MTEDHCFSFDNHRCDSSRRLTMTTADINDENFVTLHRHQSHRRRRHGNQRPVSKGRSHYSNDNCCFYPANRSASSTTRFMFLIIALLSTSAGKSFHEVDAAGDGSSGSMSSFLRTSSSFKPPAPASSSSPSLSPTIAMITPLPTHSSGDQQQQQQEKDERIQMVQQWLCDRHSYVISGRRMADFASWVNSQPGGEAKVFSLHGVDVNFEIDDIKSMELEVDLYSTTTSPSTKRQNPIGSQMNSNDPFLPDRMNLNFHRDGSFDTTSSSPSSLAVAPSHVDRYYRGSVHEWEQNPPTPLQLALRAVKLSFVFGPVISTSWLAVISKSFRQNIWYKWISNCLATSGAAFIKYGQWSSTRPDMFPQALCDALSELHNSAPAHSWNYTQEQVESSLDIPKGCLLEVFDKFDTKPLASGSIAQVHKACLKNGDVVAAKVRHPRVAELIDMDFRLMTMLATVCDWIPGLRWLHVRDSVSQFSHTMAAQAHLNVEAHHLEVLNHNFRNWKHVRFPQPFFASPALILETYERGNIVTDILDVYDEEARLLGGDFNGSDLIPVELAKFIVTSGLSLYLKMLFVDNLMHADLHPGNIMLDIHYPDGGTRGNNPKLGVTLVDAGMVAQLSDDESSSFIGLMTSLGEGDGRAAAEFAMQFSVDNNMTSKQREAFIRDMETLFSNKCGGYGTNVNVGDVLSGILGLIRDHHVRIDANYATLVINAMCVESLARRVCPSYNVLEAAKPLLQAYRKMSFEKDGFTKIGNASRNSKRLKRLMPFLLERQKGTYDSSFFKRVEVQRSSRKRVGRGGVELSSTINPSKKH